MIGAIIQARMDSRRLRGKVLKKIFNKPMLFYQIERLKKSKLLNKIIVATTVNKNDDKIINFCIRNQISYFRGDENNVLKRYIDCAKSYDITQIVRLTADCPLLEVGLLDKMIKEHCNNKYHYTSNNIKGLWPDGLDIEIIKLKTLIQINNNIKLDSDREHVTTFIKKNLNNFSFKKIQPYTNYSHIRLTVDQKEDFLLIKNLFSILYFKKKYFNLNDIIQLLNKKPDLLKYNYYIQRNEGLKKSIQND